MENAVNHESEIAKRSRRNPQSQEEDGVVARSLNQLASKDLGHFGH